MGFASSSALRVDESAMFGSLAATGAPRKLKKRPVLVLDPDELAKAHQLFQIGGAEQISEFDPLNRPARVVPIFSAAPGNAPHVIAADDDYEPPFVLEAEEEAPEEELPPIDIDAILAQSQAEADAEEALEQQAQPQLEEEPESALSRILGRAAAERSVPQAELEAEQSEPVHFDAQQEPAPEPEPEPLLLESSEPAPLPAADYSEPEPEAEPLDDLPVSEADELATEELPFAEAAPVVMPVYETGQRSELRARLVREDLTIARPQPSIWRKLAIALRRMWQQLAG